MKMKICLLAFVSVLVLTTSCKKEEGEGGSASITGYVHVTDYNASFVIVQGEYPGMDKDVYIKYGDDVGEGDRTRTGPDGRFEFKYLREGTYTLYVYSDDTTLSGTSVVSKIVEITDKKQKLDAGTFEIKKD
jgi:Polysaccharide lyase family 4, domain II